MFGWTRLLLSSNSTPICTIVNANKGSRWRKNSRHLLEHIREEPTHLTLPWWRRPKLTAFNIADQYELEVRAYQPEIRASMLIYKEGLLAETFMSTKEPTTPSLLFATRTNLYIADYTQITKHSP